MHHSLCDTAGRDLLLRHLIYYETFPEWGGLLVVLCASFVLIALAILLFKRVEPSFAKIL